MKNLLVFLLVGLVYGLEGEIDMPALYDGAAEDFEELCPGLDSACISQYFADHSDCTAVTDATRVDSLDRQGQVIYLSNCNMTVYYDKTVLSGLDKYRVTHFYVNKPTNTHVMTVCLDAITNTVEDCRFAYHVPNKQSIVKGDELFATYAVCLTAETPLEDGALRMDRTRVNAYVSDVEPTFHIGAAIMDGPEEQVAESISCLMADLPSNLQDTFAFESTTYFFALKQAQICDGGRSLDRIDYYRY